MTLRKSSAASDMVSIDTQELRRLVLKLNKMPAKIRKQLREQIEAAGDLAVDGVREQVTGTAPPRIASPIRKVRVITKKNGDKALRRRVVGFNYKQGGSGSSGLRAAIAAATRTKVTAGRASKGGAATVMVDNAKMPDRYRKAKHPNLRENPGPFSMGKAFNSDVFRHPTRGSMVNPKGGLRPRDEWTWAYQHGAKNYFGRGIFGKRAEMTRRLEAAMEAVARELDTK